MKIIKSAREMQKEAIQQKKSGVTIGFVPTMGFLHNGHTSLIKEARKRCEWLVVSIYVNPLQFAPNEDLDSYPRAPEEDAHLCAAEGVDVLFMPEELYEDNHSSYVNVEELTNELCGASRPTHFKGVTTVVARLFGLVQPDIAIFGEKDFQQLAVIRAMVRDLAMPIQILGGKLVRDHDGLALSSRNRYLSKEQRTRAVSIFQTLSLIQNAVAHGENNTHLLLKIARESLQVDELDYLEFVDPQTLRPLKKLDTEARVLIAAWVGNTRLIDNMALYPQGSGHE
ncbi:MAG: pantoate--beta-alanine ligase [Myxococcota bacterium]|nr:pantoate--beta-alanine ligase [Myxococcota bacterium]